MCATINTKINIFFILKKYKKLVAFKIYLCKIATVPTEHCAKENKQRRSKMIVETKMLSGAVWFKAIAIDAAGKLHSEVFKHRENAEVFVSSLDGKVV